MENINQSFTSPGISNIAPALSKAQGQVSAVKKTQTAKMGSFSYKYAGLDAVFEAVKESMEKNGLSLIQRFVNNGDSYLHTLLVHDSGEFIDFGFYPLGMHKTHQERGSAITYARRYVICIIFCIAAEDDDDGNRANVSLERAKSKPKITPAFSCDDECVDFSQGVETSFKLARDENELQKIVAMHKAKFSAMDQGTDLEREKVKKLRELYNDAKKRFKEQPKKDEDNFDDEIPL